MGKKVICLIVVLLVIVVGVIFYLNMPKSYLENDGTNGVAKFEYLDSESGFGVDIDAGKFPMNLEIEKGKINIKISKGKDVVFEKNDIDKSQEIVADISESGYYIISVSGNKANGKINYPVSSLNYNPVIEDKELNNDLSKESIVKNTVTDYLKKGYGDKIEEIKYTGVKIYTQNEIDNTEIMKDLNLGDNDIAFDISYELKIKEGYDLMEFTAGTGEIDGQWVKNKSNCGVAKYSELDNVYTITNFGTSF